MSHRPGGNSMNIMESYMKERPDTCIRFTSHSLSMDPVRLRQSENTLMLQNQAVSGWKLDFKDIIPYTQIYFLP